MSTRILLALDGSEMDDAAFREVWRLAAHGAQVHLLHVVPGAPVPVGTPLMGMTDVLPGPPSAVGGTGAAAHLTGSFPPSAVGDDRGAAESAIFSRAVQYLARYRQKLRDIPGQDLVRTGAPAEAILEVSLTFNIDLIVMSTRARAGIARWLMGSVSQTVLRRSQLPVLLVRRGIPARSERLRRILVPLSWSPESRAILSVVRPLALRVNAEVLLLEVVDPIHPGPGLEDIGGELARAGASWRALTTYGDPAEEIIHRSKAHDADLVAMSAPFRKGSGLIGRSVPEQVLARADRAVLLQYPLIHGKRSPESP